MASDEGSRSKRSRSGSLTQSPAIATGDTLSPLLHGSLSEVRKSVFSYLAVEDAVQLGKVSKGWNHAVKTETEVPNVTGVRTNTKTGERFWTKEPTASDKRYFKPMSALGETRSVPHIAEQRGFNSHVTDVAQVNWPSAITSKLPAGDYPTKVQYHGPRDGRPPYTLGPVDLPAKANERRVLVPAPSVAKEKPNTFIPTRDFNRALNVPSEGPLPATRQRTTLSTREASKTLSQSRSGWEGANITGRDKP